MRLLAKVSIGKIITNHFDTLKNENTKRVGFDDILTFLVFPILAASTLSFFKVGLDNNSTSIIITTLSILVGLLFNVIVIIFDIIKRDGSKKLKNKVLHQLLTNISYSIIVSILIIAITLLTFFSNCYVKLTATWIAFFLIGNYFLTVLMILKRMYILFTNELKEIESNDANKRSCCTTYSSKE